jgi:beta-lactamase class D
MRRLVLLWLVACHHAAPAVHWPARGCFVYRAANGDVIESDHARCAEPRRPYSTFKLANALIAVDAGVLEGADSPMSWDQQAVPDQADWPDSWRKPHTLRTGIAVSAVPHFRTLALALGDERMRAGLAKLGYGNRDISGGLDKFWLSGGLRISAREQLAFVEALARGTLAVSAHAQEVVRDISTLRPGLHGKTGSGSREDGHGWLVWQVGWIEKDGAIIPYAGWLERDDATLDEARAARDRELDAALHAIGG